MRKVIAISDIHGFLPNVPPCDLLIIAGDICPRWNHELDYQADWLRSDFSRWLESLPAQTIIGVAGNHDLVFQQQPNWVPKLPWVYLEDESYQWEGYKIYGTPWVRNLVRWAFYLPDGEAQLVREKIPADTDILISHSPPKNYGDRTKYNDLVGCEFLTDRIMRIQPKLVVCGHIHEGRGYYRCGPTDILNVSCLDDTYTYSRPLVDFCLDEGRVVYGYGWQS